MEHVATARWEVDDSISAPYIRSDPWPACFIHWYNTRLLWDVQVCGLCYIVGSAVHGVILSLPVRL